MYKHILLATDGSDCSCRAAERAASIAESYGSKVTLLFVEPLPQLPYGIADIGVTEDYVELQDEAGASSRDAAIACSRSMFDKRGIKFDRAEARGPAGDTIVAVSAAIDVDLIVIGHRGLNAFQSFLLGSTSERVVHAAKCSVLVVR